MVTWVTSRCSAGGAKATATVAWRDGRGLRELPKGDALACRGGGHHGCQATSELIPPCHPPRHACQRDGGAADASVEITAVAETTAQTGVEMEALTAASIAALTLYDMVKGVDSNWSSKRSGWWRRRSRERGVLTVSDGVSKAPVNLSGDVLAELLAPRVTRSPDASFGRKRRDLGSDLQAGGVRPGRAHDRGTGVGPRDVTRGHPRRPRPLGTVSPRQSGRMLLQAPHAARVGSPAFAVGRWWSTRPPGGCRTASPTGARSGRKRSRARDGAPQTYGGVVVIRGASRRSARAHRVRAVFAYVERSSRSTRCDRRADRLGDLG